MAGHSHMGTAKPVYSDIPLPTSVSKACHKLGSENWGVCVVGM
jgi:hypothetical protein